MQAKPMTIWPMVKRRHSVVRLSDGRQAHVHLSFLGFFLAIVRGGGGANILLIRLIVSLAGHKAVNGYRRRISGDNGDGLFATGRKAAWKAANARIAPRGQAKPMAWEPRKGLKDHGDAR